MVELHWVLWDHPRLRGEKLYNIANAIFPLGSPPLTRGKVVFPANPAAHVGITPAYAGKSDELNDSVIEDKDHPRLRGEKGSAEPFGVIGLGSPPLTRGKAQGR